MKIGIAGPVSLQLLKHLVRNGGEMPRGYEFPLLALFVKEYIRLGHHVVFFTLDPSTVAPRTFSGPNLTIHIGRYRPHGRARDFFSVEQSDLITAMTADPCDIIHAHWTYEFALATLRTGQPNLITAHDAPLNILRYNHSPYRILRTVLAIIVIHRARNMTTVSPYVSNHLKKIFRYQGNIKIIPNGLPNSFFQKPVIRQNNNRVIFASIAVGWSKLKNISTLLLAFSIARKSNPEIELWLFGNEQGPGEFAETWAKAKNSHEGVRFIGRVNHQDLRETLVDNADVLIHPSLEEACPMAVMEGMALGIPVIGGERSGGVPYVLGYGEAGRLVDVTSAESLCREIQLFASNPNLRSRIGTAGYNYAANHFVLENVSSQYIKEYKSIRDSGIHT
jgi:L-malate glycosyltransferase